MKQIRVLLWIMSVSLLLVNAGKAQVVYDDGQMHEIDYNLQGHVDIYDGPEDQPTTVKLVADGAISDVDVYENSRFFMSGGTHWGSLVLHDSSRGEVSGGVVDEDPFSIVNNSQLIITGDDFSEGLRVRNEGQVYIYGSDFTIYGNPVGYGPIQVSEGRLEGTLLNGQIRSNLDIQDNGMVTLVPEPASLSLLLLGTLLLRRKRNR